MHNLICLINNILFVKGSLKFPILPIDHIVLSCQICVQNILLIKWRHPFSYRFCFISELMEPPPRLYTYKGLFTESRSLDLTLKIVSTVLSFLVFLFLIAWRISKKVSNCDSPIKNLKHYNNPPIDKRLRFNSFNDLCNNGSFSLTSFYASRRQKFPLVRGYLNKQKVLFVEDWKVITLYNQFPLLDLHYSSAPSKFKIMNLLIAFPLILFQNINCLFNVWLTCLLKWTTLFVRKDNDNCQWVKIII